jgi:hypothetical protein
MGKFDHIWHDLKPKAIRLREEGLTPQQTCTELAWTEFKDKLVNPVPWDQGLIYFIGRSSIQWRDGINGRSWIGLLSKIQQASMNVDHGRSAYPVSNNKLITTPIAPQLFSHHNASRIIHKFTESSRGQFQVHLSSQVAFHTKQAIKINISKMPLR